jgi:glycosyltransferase involved in cell wall biosynthesis
MSGHGALDAKRERFAFIQMGSFSQANQHVLKQLQERFPALKADVIDVGELNVIRRSRLPQLALAVAAEFGTSACIGRDRFYRHILKTAYFFRRARHDLLRRLQHERYAFTFQTQSLIDAHCPGTTHFIYTDHTHRENFKYPLMTAATPMSLRWAQLEKSTYHNANMIFTMSGNISRSLLEEYDCPPHKVACVYAGGNLAADTAGGIDNSRFRNKDILFVGVDWERKGGPDLLEAFRTVRRTHPEATLTIVGCSPQLSEPGVRIRGRVPLKEVADYYRRASVFCLPTLNEPFGFVFLEAFAYGLPVVATRLGAIPEIVTNGESGYLVPPQDPGQLAARLTQLLGDPACCERFGAQGRKSVDERYSWQAVGEKLAGHIERVTKLSARQQTARPCTGSLQGSEA